jgi:hypothetical protein
MVFELPPLFLPCLRPRRRRARRRRARRCLRPVEVLGVAVVVVVVVLEFVFCAKTRLPKHRTKTRAKTIPSFLITEGSPFGVPLCGVDHDQRACTITSETEMVSVPFLVTQIAVQSLAFDRTCNTYAIASMTTDSNLHSLLAHRPPQEKFCCGICASRAQSCHKEQNSESRIQESE